VTAVTTWQDKSLMWHENMAAVATGKVRREAFWAQDTI